jgi:mannose-6-phosphate isomerase-like protein (cupin superfamily)
LNLARLITGGKSMPFKPKRIVTGHDEEGNSIILMNGEAPNSRLLTAAGGLQRTELWETKFFPVDNSGSADAAEHTNTFEPAPQGTMFRTVEYPPDSVRLKNLDPAAHFGEAADRSGKRHPGMHKTHTIDYAIVLSGEIYAVMEKGEALLRAGDCLVQRGTNHAWSNRSEVPCVVAFVMISALPL